MAQQRGRRVDNGSEDRVPYNEHFLALRELAVQSLTRTNRISNAVTEIRQRITEGEDQREALSAWERQLEKAEEETQQFKVVVKRCETILRSKTAEHTQNLAGLEVDASKPVPTFKEHLQDVRGLASTIITRKVRLQHQIESLREKIQSGEDCRAQLKAWEGRLKQAETDVAKIRRIVERAEAWASAD